MLPRLPQPRAFVPLAVVALLATGQPPAARADLHAYVKKAEPAYAWKLRKKLDHGEGTIYDLHLVSQTWQGITWQHDLQLYVPKNVKPGQTMFLWNTGGKANPAGALMGLDLAAKMRAPVAFLYNVPNQPLLGGKSEDALIAETFVRYLKTKDGEWPLLFPMVKSVVKAMDALQELAKKEWEVEVKQFLVSGASKRGWTSWLTGAADPRVKAIAPLVIDTLNMPKQMPHQLRSFGRYSDMIRDYTKRGLVPMPDTPEAKKLWSMVDPWAYRARLKMPKLIVNGTNDPYWAQDALNLYWDDLAGDKWVLYVPNAGHNLQQKVGGRADLTRAVNTLAAYGRHQLADRPMPKLSWKHEGAAGKFRLTVRGTPAPKAARLWVADAPTRDFRKATWAERPAALAGGVVRGEVEAPADGYRAFFAECEYEIDGLRYYLSTQIRIVGKPGT
jgi:PhoPQ-activated pathogenicity-related protein